LTFGEWDRSHARKVSALTISSLTDEYIVFRGGDDEAASAHLKGTLVLCLSEPLTIKHIRLQLTGMSRVWYVNPSAARRKTPRPQEKTGKFLKN
jgi:hypothetical protein